MPPKKQVKKNPCPDCGFCQWCNDEKCAMCRHDCRKDPRRKRKPHKPLFLKY